MDEEGTTFWGQRSQRTQHEITPAMPSAHRAAAEKASAASRAAAIKTRRPQPGWRRNVPRASRPRRLALPASERFIYTHNDGTATEDSTKLSSVGSRLDRIRRRNTAARTGALAATPHNRRRQPLPCCGGGDRMHHRRVRYSRGTTQGRRPTMRRDLQAFVLSVGGLLAVAGCALLVLWAMVS